ncbi:uncharacterized protein LOC143630503 isoform X1 [Bidens hawaiensis]|uniref:uncharacterized protein LOC143630503 isoform X1 n=1 Tax=Bidens hawaiensis TaxID=980011 RepID=UPI004049C6CC
MMKMEMKLRSMASVLVRSRVLSANARTINIIHSTPAVKPRVHADRLFIPRHSQSSISSTLPALLPVFIGLSLTPAFAEDDATDSVGLQKIDDGSVVSNIHTSKWRVFTDSARDFFFQARLLLLLLLLSEIIVFTYASICFCLKGKLEDAERLFIGALEEARQGFGERDPHVASACNNLAELYRVKKAFDKAEPLYLEAINILEESYGLEDIRYSIHLASFTLLFSVHPTICFRYYLAISCETMFFVNIWLLKLCTTMYQINVGVCLKSLFSHVCLKFELSILTTFHLLVS